MQLINFGHKQILVGQQVTPSQVYFSKRDNYMTNQPDRLDRIEATLDRQLEVNAELRTSVVELRTSVVEVRNSVVEVRNSVTELRVTAEALLQTVQIHQQNFEIIVDEIRQMHSEIRGLQTENRRIWERLEQKDRE
jgi:methyl-accepting chemotaxis protein